MTIKYVITGRVQPERADVHFQRVEMGLRDHGRAVLSCVSSQITIVLENDQLDGWLAAVVQAEDLASVIVGSLGFSLGSGYSVDLIQVTEEDGTPHVLGVRPNDPNKPDVVETLGFGDGYLQVFNRALQLASRDIFYRLAMRDYLQAINDTSDCATYCFRAIESIKSSYSFRSGNDRWEEMHEALGTDRETITSVIKNFADPIRHGNWVNAKHTDKFIRWRMLKLTKQILKKYLDAEQPVI